MFFAKICASNILLIPPNLFKNAAGESSESSSGINWATIIFIAGMMVMVEGMAKAGFFQWLCMRLAKLVHYKPVPLFSPVFVKKSLKEYPKEVPIIIFGGSPHIVAEPPRFSQKISDKIIGTGLNCW